MKTPFFTRPDAGRPKTALILLLVAVAIIAISIPGMILSKGSTLFAILYFAGFTLFFYALLHPWQKAWYYAISIAIFAGVPILIINLNIGDDFLVKMERAGKLPVHGAEDLAWAIGGVFAAGILAGIIGIVRTLMYRYHDDDQ
ncbi:MAG: hypothetical protein ACOYNU_08455 [Bacteroidales bacterium]